MLENINEFIERNEIRLFVINNDMVVKEVFVRDICMNSSVEYDRWNDELIVNLENKGIISVISYM